MAYIVGKKQLANGVFDFEDQQNETKQNIATKTEEKYSLMRC